MIGCCGGMFCLCDPVGQSAVKVCSARTVSEGCVVVHCCGACCGAVEVCRGGVFWWCVVLMCCAGMLCWCVVVVCCGVVL